MFLKPDYNLKNVYESFSNSLKEIGMNVNEQKNFISNYVKEHFNYLRMEYGQIINLTEHFDAQRNLYENFCKKLKAKKLLRKSSAAFVGIICSVFSFSVLRSILLRFLR